MIKQISNKLKAVCPNQKKNLKQVLSIVSSVDLTLRFTHSRIGAIDLATKQLRKANTKIFQRLTKLDRKLTTITKMMRKAINGDKPKSVTICETKKTTITCKKGKKMNILHANYGRLNKNTCGKSTVTNCRASTSLGIVQKTCKGKVSCALHASKSVFGDPCRGVRKYLTVKYKCE